MWNDRNPSLPPRRCSYGMLRALIVAALAAGFLQGCGAVVVGGIALGAAVMHDRRDDETVLQDQNIELQAMQIVNDNPDIKQGCRIAPTSYNLVVLLTGQCAEQELTNSLAEKVSRLAKVRRVVDEITIGPLASLTQESADVLITSRATFAISEVDIDDFDATRVKVVTEQGVVYLMGLLTPDEADAVVEKVRYVSGVKKVIKVFEYIQPTTETG